MKKWILSFVLTFAMTCAIVPVVATAATSGKCGDNLTWTYDAIDGSLVIAGRGDMYDYGHNDNLAPWNEYRSSITTVNLPDRITHIGNFAFTDCKNVKNIIIPYGVISIGKNAFYFCQSLEQIDIPNSVIEIGDAAFYSCDNLTRATLSNNISLISYSLFGSCEKLEQIVLPDKITSIESYAFSHNKALKNIIIPKNVTTIDFQAFNECNNLENIVFDGNAPRLGNHVFDGVNGTMYYRSGNIGFGSTFGGLPTKELPQLECIYKSMVNDRNIEIIVPYNTNTINQQILKVPDGDCKLYNDIACTSQINGDINVSNNIYAKVTYNGLNDYEEIYTITFIHQIPAVTASISNQSYIAKGFYVSLNSEEGAEIYYTTDGTLPDENSEIFNSPIILSGNTTIKAVAKKEGYIDSDIAEFVYYEAETPQVTDCENYKFNVNKKNIEIIIPYGTMNIDLPILNISNGTYKLYNDRDCVVEAENNIDASGNFPTLYAKVFYNTVQEYADVYTVTFLEQLPKVDISISADKAVSISSNIKNAYIYYTTDGSEPSKKSKIYNNPFYVNAGSVIKAIVSKNGYIDSDTEVYFVINLIEPSNSTIDGNMIYCNTNEERVDISLNTGSNMEYEIFEDKACTISVSNTRWILDYGNNVRYIKVTSKNGGSAVYTINVCRSFTNISYDNHLVTITSVKEIQNATLIFAEYNEDTCLVDVKYKPISIIQGEQSFDSLLNVKDGNYIKIMLWDDILGMQPLTDAVKQ